MKLSFFSIATDTFGFLIQVKLKDEPDALAKIARRFTDAGISMRSIRIIQRNSQHGLVVISTKRTDDALALVNDVLIS